MSRPLRIDVYAYLDYRAFLRDAYAELKARGRGFSYRAFARRAGMSSPNFLKLVIEGQRNLTTQSAAQFATALELSEKESQFFTELVAFNQATTASEKNLAFGRIGKHRKHRRVRKLDRGMFAYLSKWYFPAIRELVGCRSFREDPEWIATALTPTISVAQAREALALLEELGLVERADDGRLVQGEPLVSTGAEVRSLGIGNFHRQMMERAAASIEGVDRQDREISGLTVALSAEGFALFKERIQALRAELLELSAQEQDPTRVVQFNFQAFPLALPKDEVS